MDGLDRRRLLGLLAGAGVAGLTGGLSGCSSTTETGPRTGVRIGLLAPASGPNKSIGLDLESGFRLYLEQHDNLLSGHPVELVVEPEGDTIEAGVEALNRLYGKQVVAVTGIANSELLPNVRDLVEKTKVPLLATHASPASMPSAIYIWRTSFINDEPGRAVGAYLKRQPGKVALITLKGAAENELFSGFAKEFGTGGGDPVQVVETAKPTAAYLATYVNQLAATSPRSVFCHLPTSYMVPFLQAVRAAGKGGWSIFASGVVSEGTALDQMGSGSSGLFTAMHYSADLSNAANRSFSSLYQAKYQRSPTGYAVASYDAAAVLDRAVALCGNEVITAQRVNQLIAEVGQVSSPRGNWQFNQGRSPQQKWYLRQIRMDGPILSNVLISDLATLG